jgi:hypothetical protein
MMEPVSSSETLVYIYLTTRRHIPDNSFHNRHHHENFESHRIKRKLNVTKEM